MSEQIRQRIRRIRVTSETGWVVSDYIQRETWLRMSGASSVWILVDTEVLDGSVWGEP